MEARQVIEVVDRVIERLPGDPLVELGADAYKRLYRSVVKDVQAAAERIERETVERLESEEAMLGAAPEVPEEFQACLQEWLEGGGTLAEFLELNEAELGTVAGIQAEVAKPIPGAQVRKIPPSQALAYRDGVDRARAAARETYYDGLIDLLRQARRVGDATLEFAVWDVCDEFDRETPNYNWRETVEFGLEAPTRPEGR